MGAAENLATHIQWADADDRRDLSRHGEFVHEDIVVHHLDGAAVIGRDALIANMKDSIAALPDYHVVIQDRFATDDRVLCRWAVSGTPQAAAGVAEPKQAPIEVAGLSLWAFDDGRAREGWVCSNAVYLMRQGMDRADSYSVHAHDVDVSSPSSEPAAPPVSTSLAAPPTSAVAAANLATHIDWSEANDRHDLSHYDDYMHRDIEVYHLDGSTVRGIDAVAKGMADSIAAMPERRVIVDDRFATDDRVVCRWRISGTPNVGGVRQEIQVAGISVWEFSEGKARRGWACSNAAFLMQQGAGTAFARASDAYQPERPRDSATE